LRLLTANRCPMRYDHTERLRPLLTLNRSRFASLDGPQSRLCRRTAFAIAASPERGSPERRDFPV